MGFAGVSTLRWLMVDVRNSFSLLFYILGLFTCVNAQDSIATVNMDTVGTAARISIIVQDSLPMAKPAEPYSSIHFWGSDVGPQTAYRYSQGEWQMLCILPCSIKEDMKKTPLIKIHRDHGGWFDNVDAVDTIPLLPGKEVDVATSSHVNHLHALRTVLTNGPLAGAALGGLVGAGLEAVFDTLSGEKASGVLALSFSALGFSIGFVAPLVSWMSGGFLVDEIQSQELSTLAMSQRPRPMVPLHKRSSDVEYRFLKSPQPGVQSVFEVKPTGRSDSLEFLCEIPCTALVDSGSAMNILIRRDLSTIPGTPGRGMVEERKWLQDPAGSVNEISTQTESKIPASWFGSFFLFPVLGGAIDYMVYVQYDRHHLSSLQLAAGLVMGSWLAIAPTMYIWERRYRTSDQIRMKRVQLSAVPLLSAQGHVGAAVVGRM